MKLYQVNYDGVWLGGKALVFAETPEEAIAKVEADPRTTNFNPDFITIKETEMKDVVYNDNGDY